MNNTRALLCSRVPKANIIWSYTFTITELKLKMLYITWIFTAYSQLIQSLLLSDPLGVLDLEEHAGSSEKEGIEPSSTHNPVARGKNQVVKPNTSSSPTPTVAAATNHRTTSTSSTPTIARAGNVRTPPMFLPPPLLQMLTTELTFCHHLSCIFQSSYKNSCMQWTRRVTKRNCPRKHFEWSILYLLNTPVSLPSGIDVYSEQTKCSCPNEVTEQANVMFSVITQTLLRYNTIATYTVIVQSHQVKIRTCP